MSRILYDYRRKNGLCVNCGEIANGSQTRCLLCRQIERVKARSRYATLSPEEKHQRYLKEQAWRDAHPEKVAAYKSRKPEYDRRYRTK